MTYYAKSEAVIELVAGPDVPPLVIWGPGDPRPTLPIAGWNPDTGEWPTQPLPPNIWGPNDPRPTVPIAEPPWGWGGTPPEIPDVVPGWDATYGWTETTGWIVFAVPTKPVPTPSRKK